MNRKFVAMVAVFAALTATSAWAQDKAPPKASKADVQKLVDSIKADKAKMAEFCVYVKLQNQAEEAQEKKDTKKLEDIDKQLADAVKKLGPDFDRIVGNSELDEETGALLENLSKTCT
jgi:hypothetical protein